MSDPREQFKRLRDRARSGEMLRDNAQAREDQEEEQAAYYESHPWDRATVFKYWDEPPNVPFHLSKEGAGTDLRVPVPSGQGAHRSRYCSIDQPTNRRD